MMCVLLLDRCVARGPCDVLPRHPRVCPWCRFADFVDDVMVAPVRETAAQALGLAGLCARCVCSGAARNALRAVAALPSADAAAATSALVRRIAFASVRDGRCIMTFVVAGWAQISIITPPTVIEEWHARYGVLCGLKYIFAAASCATVGAPGSTGLATVTEAAREAVRATLTCIRDEHDDVQVCALVNGYGTSARLTWQQAACCEMLRVCVPLAALHGDIDGVAEATLCGIDDTTADDLSAALGPSLELLAAALEYRATCAAVVGDATRARGLWARAACAVARHAMHVLPGVRRASWGVAAALLACEQRMSAGVAVVAAARVRSQRRPSCEPVRSCVLVLLPAALGAATCDSETSVRDVAARFVVAVFGSDLAASTSEVARTGLWRLPCPSSWPESGVAGAERGAGSSEHAAASSVGALALEWLELAALPDGDRCAVPVAVPDSSSSVEASGVDLPRSRKRARVCVRAEVSSRSAPGVAASGGGELELTPAARVYESSGVARDTVVRLLAELVRSRDDVACCGLLEAAARMLDRVSVSSMSARDCAAAETACWLLCALWLAPRLRGAGGAVAASLHSFISARIHLLEALPADDTPNRSCTALERVLAAAAAAVVASKSMPARAGDVLRPLMHAVVLEDPRGPRADRASVAVADAIVACARDGRVSAAGAGVTNLCTIVGRGSVRGGGCDGGVLCAERALGALARHLGPALLPELRACVEAVVSVGVAAAGDEPAHCSGEDVDSSAVPAAWVPPLIGARVIAAIAGQGTAHALDVNRLLPGLLRCVCSRVPLVAAAAAAAVAAWTLGDREACLPVIASEGAAAAASVVPRVRAGAARVAAAVVAAARPCDIPAIAPWLVCHVAALMSDAAASVRGPAAAAFSTLIPLLGAAETMAPQCNVPVDAAVAASGSSERERGLAFIGTLFGGVRSPCADGGALVVPGEAPGSPPLRGYQRDGVEWLAFLRRTCMHGVLADDMVRSSVRGDRFYCCLLCCGRMRRGRARRGRRCALLSLP